MIFIGIFVVNLEGRNESMLVFMLTRTITPWSYMAMGTEPELK